MRKPFSSFSITSDWGLIVADFLREYRIDLDVEIWNPRFTWRKFCVRLYGLGGESRVAYAVSDDGDGDGDGNGRNGSKSRNGKSGKNGIPAHLPPDTTIGPAITAENSLPIFMAITGAGDINA